MIRTIPLFCLESIFSVHSSLQMQKYGCSIKLNTFGILMAGWAPWCCAPCFCQQARSSQRYECCWDHWQAWTTLPAPATLVNYIWLSAKYIRTNRKLLLTRSGMLSFRFASPTFCDFFSSYHVIAFRYIQSTCATTGEGLYEGLDWLSSNIASKVYSFFFYSTKSAVILRSLLYGSDTFPPFPASVGLRPGYGYQLRTD